MTAAFDQKVQETEGQWVPATPLDAIQDPPLRCRVKETPKGEWKESTLVGFDRSDEYGWCVDDLDVQWAVVCEVWKEPIKPVEKIISDWLYYELLELAGVLKEQLQKIAKAKAAKTQEIESRKQSKLCICCGDDRDIKRCGYCQQCWSELTNGIIAPPMISERQLESAKCRVVRKGTEMS